MGLHGIGADEELIGDFLVAEAGGDELENFELARGDGELLEAGGIGRKGFAGGWRGLDDDLGLFACERDAEPDAHCGEDDGDKPAIDFDGVLDDEEAVFGEFEQRDEDAASEAVEEDVAEGAAAGIARGFGFGRHAVGEIITEESENSEKPANSKLRRH